MGSRRHGDATRAGSSCRSAECLCQSFKRRAAREGTGCRDARILPASAGFIVEAVWRRSLDLRQQLAGQQSRRAVWRVAQNCSGLLPRRRPGGRGEILLEKFARCLSLGAAWSSPEVGVRFVIAFLILLCLVCFQASAQPGDRVPVPSVAPPAGSLPAVRDTCANFWTLAP